MWAALLSRFRRAEPAPAPAATFPSGLGMFVRWPRPRVLALPSGATTALVLVDRAGKAPRREALTREWVFGHGATALRIIPWAFCAPGRVMSAVPTLIASARAASESWVCLDIEGPEWRPAWPAADLKRAIDALHAAGLSVAVTAYGRPWTMAGWAPCLACDAGLVQLARVGGSAQVMIDDWRDRFAVLGTVPQPYEASRVAVDHGSLVADLLSRTPFAAPWVLDWYAPRPVAQRQLTAAARTIPA